MLLPNCKNYEKIGRSFTILQPIANVYIQAVGGSADECMNTRCACDNWFSAKV